VSTETFDTTVPHPARFQPAVWAASGGAGGAARVFLCGLRVVSVDGATTDVPHTEANDAAFGRPFTA
jgi:hypothetical protein